MKDKTQNTKNDVVKVRGTITGAMFGTTQFDKTDKYRVSVKFDEGEREKLVGACKDIYKDAGSFIPKWFKDEKSEYINFKSNYDIPCVYVKDGERVEDGFAHILSEYGTISGSKVIVAVTVKDGAVYPKAIAFIELVKASIDDLFDPDELPFK